MYKTVRHGENSLQYTILPQQDDGTAHAATTRPRRGKRKGKTAAVLAVTVMLICAVVATAVLVPLLLTTDLVALPSAFQRFSVSSLHQTHSGNQILVVAKKPHGWNGSHHSSTSTTTSTTTTTTTTTEIPQTEEVVVVTDPPTPSTTQPTVEPTIEPTIAINLTTTENIGTNSYDKLMEDKIKFYNNKYTKFPSGRSYIEISTSTVASKLDGDSMIVFMDVQTTQSPSWLQTRWGVPPYYQWMGYTIKDSVVIPFMLVSVLLSFCAITVFVIMLLRKMSRNKRIVLENVSSEGDKATLLKEAAVASEEE